MDSVSLFGLAVASGTLQELQHIHRRTSGLNAEIHPDKDNAFRNGLKHFAVSRTTFVRLGWHVGTFDFEMSAFSLLPQRPRTVAVPGPVRRTKYLNGHVDVHVLELDDAVRGDPRQNPCRRQRLKVHAVILALVHPANLLPAQRRCWIQRRDITQP